MPYAAQPSSSSQKDLPSDRRVAAMISLLADEDPSIHLLIRKKLIGYGQPAVSWLKPHLLCDDPLLRRRAHEIVSHLERQAADTLFLAFCLGHGEDLDLEEGVWRLARTRYPAANPEGYRAWLDDYGVHLTERIDFSATPATILGSINHYLFQELGYAGDKEDYYNPENSYLNRVMDRRLGNPISLCVLYLFLCRRLRLPVAGVGMPGHFLCRYQSSTEEWYIDAFHQGRLLRRADCVKYLLQHGTGFHESFLGPATPRRILQRVCANLLQIHHQANQSAETARVQRYIVALAK
jgi:regulator of sirC expression with transglutaminase-like and TPR domain